MMQHKYHCPTTNLSADVLEEEFVLLRQDAMSFCDMCSMSL